MKRFFIIIYLLSFKCFATDYNNACLYNTNYQSSRYNIEITYCCEEGELDCDKVYYKGTNKIDKSSIQLKGKTINNYLSHSFLGYEFQNNEYLYVIRNNLLSIYKQQKLLQQEKLYESN